MNRRQFLLTSPAAVAGGVAHALAGAGPDAAPLLDPIVQRTLLHQAGADFAALGDMRPRWWLHPDVRAKATSMVNVLAEVWCRRRGMAQTEPGYPDWLYLAQLQKDESSGVPWRVAHTAINLLCKHADHMRNWDAEAKRKGAHVLYSSIENSRREVTAVIDACGACMAAVHRELNVLEPRFPD